MNIKGTRFTVFETPWIGRDRFLGEQGVIDQ